MPRPRVRRKIKNPSSKVSRKQKNPYKVSFAGAHPLIQKHWDKTKTLKQNYEKLGLCPQLNGYSGGQGQEENQAYQKTMASLSSKLSLPVEWRDRQEDSITLSQENSNSTDTPILEVEPPKFIDDRSLSIGSKVGMKKIRDQSVSMTISNESTCSILQEIQNEAAKDSVKCIRAPSFQEDVILTNLEKKYGNDFDAMAKDMKLNKYQLTPGQLKKRFARVLLKKAGISMVKREI